MTGIQVTRVAAVTVVTLANGPLNLLTVAGRRELETLAHKLRGDEETRAVVITGSGRCFSAGTDITEFPRDAAAGRARSRTEHACADAIAALPQPVIAALHGHVLGGGLELALACDLRVADETARLGLPEVKLGVFPSAGGTQRLPRVIGASRAKELMFRGDTVDARRALELGIVDHVVEAGTARTFALELATTIASRPARAVQAIKAAVDGGLSNGAATGRQLEANLIGELYATQDAQEGVAAFLERRPPVFRHR
ncbi:enoyl-CoA hydratase [Planosporangium thailandense]|uniref:Enoyl-CoA hydratase n=1 Tax=Planosporangium thailandense TaxID=765197 RepID=A0ABX0Y7P1_9ACTN|nr:enoyl-CoA hydratase-related protein [Planosporangium thailandense]NJC73422.1 enoyl-CoA hydratase [Planosporangium thailandense]